MPTEPKGPKPPVPGVLSMQAKFTTDSFPWSTIFHIVKNVLTFWSSDDITSALTQLLASLVSEVIPLVQASTTLVSAEGTDLTSAMGLKLSVISGDPGTGPGTHGLPISNVMRINFPSPLRYRGGRAGQSWSGLDQSNLVSSRQWESAVATAWQSAIKNVLLALSGGSLPSGSTFDPCWISYFSGFAFREPPLVFKISDPAATTAQERVCSRRRRLGRPIADL